MPARRARARRERPAKPGALRRAIGYLGQQGRSTTIAYAALVIATLAQLAVPQLVQNMIEAITRGYTARQILALPSLAQSLAATAAGTSVAQLQADANSAEPVLIGAALAIVLFAVVRGLFSFVQAFMAEKTSQGIAFDLRNAIFSKIQRLSFSYYDRNQTGQLLTRAVDDVEKVRLFIAQGLILAVAALVLLAVTLIILFATNAALALVVLPIMPLALLLFMAFGIISQPLFVAVQNRISALNTILQENLAGIKVVKAFTREKHEQGRFKEAADGLFSQQLKVARTLSILFPIVFLLAQVGQALILYFGGVQIINGTLRLSEYQSFSLYLVYIFFPIGQLGFIISLMAQASASASRIFEILDAESDVKDKPNAVALPPMRGEVEFREVTFKYFNSGNAVLSEVSFKAAPGQTVALLGATGSGKTTIINLIPRFYDVSAGAVLIDGHDVRDVRLDSLREQIGIVLQETTLFSGTIRDNIAFGRPNATLDEVVAAATAAAAHEFITSFPQGYETPVGERGTTLSGGQKQRIAIARALLLDPRLLILDDSTSSVDLLTEYQIQQALDRLMKGRTSFVIAQRISTVRNADLILVLEKGRLVGSGKHEELLEHNAIYAEIYHSQLLGDAEQAEPAAKPEAQEAHEPR
jgi:ATP-binding cassette subfamily B protein